MAERAGRVGASFRHDPRRFQNGEIPRAHGGPLFPSLASEARIAALASFSRFDQRRCAASFRNVAIITSISPNVL